ncbi:MAG: flagellin [Candidatus Auribacterota bacterium]|uniref:Flagellin n=1 Tax=Candidatus Auribacter fodinae TaxID=2093366 RepID=A0A3A4R5U7_9BACT|nr:MAG: hypothetical protein C4541_01265 [Candidatus Auribacter fodinae]
MGDLARIQTNVASLRAYHTLTGVNTNLVRSQERISTGKVVNRSSDGPSDYYISRTLSRDIDGIERKRKNVERGLNFLQTNSSRLAQITNILVEASSLAHQANSIGVSSAERQAIQQDLRQLMEEVEAIFESGVSARLYTGFSLEGLQNVSLTGNLTINPLASLTLDGTNLNVTGTTLDIERTIMNIDNALGAVLLSEEQLGSLIRRLEIEDVASADEITNLLASRSTIMDSDLAEEQMNLTNMQIIQQAAISMLAQANSAPQSILTLFS